MPALFSPTPPAGSPFGPLRIERSAAAGDAPGASARDRHGRGFRALVLPPHVPGYRTRRETFEELAVEAAQDIAARLGALRLEAGPYLVEIEDVPAEGAVRTAEREGPQLSKLEHAPGHEPTLTLYRRPIECAVRGRRELGTLLYRVMLGEVAASLHMEPHDIDPLM
ncbi:hypothetical protein JT358_14395 [Micrococcales bacterium 31B]|nr:hypothetical protein [Micrococcales bacterium 31B]